MIQLTLDIKVETPTRRRGGIVVPPGSDYLPLYCLVLFPSGDRQWVLAEILNPVAIKEPQLLTLEKARIN